MRVCVVVCRTLYLRVFLCIYLLICRSICRIIYPSDFRPVSVQVFVDQPNTTLTIDNSAEESCGIVEDSVDATQLLTSLEDDRRYD